MNFYAELGFREIRDAAILHLIVTGTQHPVVYTFKAATSTNTPCWRSCPGPF